MERPDDELRDAPLLRKLRGSDPFVAPDGYFGGFPHQVQDRLRTGARIRPWYFRPALIGSTVACLGLVIGLGWWNMRSPNVATGHTPAVAEVPEVSAPDSFDWSRSDAALAHELLYVEEAPTLAVVDLPLTDDEWLGYLYHADIPLDILIEEL